MRKIVTVLLCGAYLFVSSAELVSADMDDSTAFERIKAARIDMVHEDMLSLNGEWFDAEESVYMIENDKGYKISNRDYDRNQITSFIIERNNDGSFRFIFEPDYFRTVHAFNRIPENVAEEIVRQNIHPYALLKYANPNTLSGGYYSYKAVWDYSGKITSIKQDHLRSVFTLNRAKIPYYYQGGGLYRHYSGDYNEFSENIFQKSPSIVHPTTFVRY